MDLEAKAKAPSSMQTDAPYSIFSPRQRYTIVSLACLSGFLSPLSSFLYTPALPTIAKDLGVSISKVNLTVTTFLIFQGTVPTLWGTLGDLYGRRMLYIVMSTISSCACIGLSITNSYAAVLALRALQAVGTASSATLAAGLIRDLVPPETRGGVMGWYSAGIGAGTAFGPFLGGILAQFVGWHGIFYFLLGWSLAIAISVILLLPETLHSIVGNGSIEPPRYLRPPIRWLCPKTDSPPFQRDICLANVGHALLETVRMIMYIEVLCAVVFVGVCWAVWQDSIVETSVRYSQAYNLSQLNIGLTYISGGVGALIGNIIIGMVLDANYKQQLKKETIVGSSTSNTRRVIYVEKARLLSLSFFGPAFIVSLIAFGWVLQARVYIEVPIILSFFVGCFDSGVYTSFSTLIIDMFEDRPSAAIAINNLVRCLLGAVATATIAPTIKTLGFGWSFTVLGLICVAFLPLPWAQYRYGYQWRIKRQERAKKAGSHDMDNVQSTSFETSSDSK